MSLTKKTVTGYKDSLFTTITGKIDGAMKELLKANLKMAEDKRLTDEEISFQAHKRVFDTVRTTSAYTKEEARTVIMHHYLLTSEEVKSKLDAKIASRMGNYPVFSDCLPTTSQNNYSVKIDGKMYCSSDNNSHCKLVDECVSDVMRTVFPQVIQFIEGIEPKERIELLQSVIPFVKHETNERIKIERSEYSRTLLKPVMSFSSTETLKGYAVRQSMPFVIHAYMRKNNELTKKNPNENPGENI